MVHDIEESPLKVDYYFDAAIFESTMHHFYDPVSVMKNVAKCLKEEAAVVIAEGFAPGKDTGPYKHLMEVMEKYHTLERPYTKKQMIRLMGFVGLEHYRFIYPVCGFSDLEQDEKDFERLPVHGPNYIYMFASRMSKTVEGLGKPRDIPDSVFKAWISVEDLPERIQVGEVYEFKAKVKNISSVTWSYDKEKEYLGPYVISLSYHWLDAGGNTVIFDGLRTALPHEMDPGREVGLKAEVKAPEKPGEYIIEFDVVQERITWFANKGSKTLRKRITVI
jgi:SAM-dependent methyltransferase